MEIYHVDKKNPFYQMASNNNHIYKSKSDPYPNNVSLKLHHHSSAVYHGGNKLKAKYSAEHFILVLVIISRYLDTHTLLSQ